MKDDGSDYRVSLAECRVRASYRSAGPCHLLCAPAALTTPRRPWSRCDGLSQINEDTGGPSWVMEEWRCLCTEVQRVSVHKRSTRVESSSTTSYLTPGPDQSAAGCCTSAMLRRPPQPRPSRSPWWSPTKPRKLSSFSAVDLAWRLLYVVATSWIKLQLRLLLFCGFEYRV